MKFKAGDLVVVSIIDYIDLYTLTSSGLGSVSSHMSANEFALVIGTTSNDSSLVYVIGPHGPGWAFGAFLKHLDR